MFIMKREFERLIQEAYELGLNNGYDIGYKLRQVEHGAKGFITGPTQFTTPWFNSDQFDLFKEIEEYLKRGV